MHKKFLIPFAAGLALCAGAAFAADQSEAPPPAGGHHWRMDRKDMAKHFKARCSSHYARAVGDMAYLETRLNLTAAQKPAFDHWKGIVLGSEKSAEQACLNHKVPDKRPTAVEMAKFGEHMLEMKLDGIKAQMPALETLYAKLTPDQDRIMDRAAMRLVHEHGRHGHHGWDHGGMHGRHGPDHEGMHGPMNGPGPDGSGPN